MARQILIQQRRDTAANWTSTNPILASGEPGFEIDTGKQKIGDGSSAWNSLGYMALEEWVEAGFASGPSSFTSLAVGLPETTTGVVTLSDADSINAINLTHAGTLTANRTVNLPDLDGTLALIESPVFTGTPLAPTVSTSDSSTSIATTALVSNKLASFTGSSNIVTVGTITSGTWSGTEITVAKGGTGLSSATAYAVLCGGTTGTGAFQSLSTGSVGQLLASGGASALPTFAAGTTVNTSTGALTNTQNSLGTTTTPGLTLVNTTDAANGAQQVSPSVRFEFEAWKSNATAASQVNGFQIYGLGVQGTAASSATLKIQASIASGAYADVMSIDSSGSVNCARFGGASGGPYLLTGANSPSFGLSLASSSVIGWANGSASTSFTASVDTRLTRAAAANLRQGDADAAAPVAQTFSVQNVSTGTSNTAGADRYYDASQGTGTGAGGSHIFRTAPAGGAGSSQNALAAALAIAGSGAATFASTVTISGSANFQTPSGFRVTSLNTNGFFTAGGGYMIHTAAHKLRLSGNGDATGGSLLLDTADVIKFRNLANTADGDITAGAITASGAVAMTAGIASTTTTTGTLVVTGGVGVSGDVYVGGRLATGLSLKLANGSLFADGGGDGVFTFYNSTATSVNRICLGSPTSSFPAIKRNGAAINFRLADDSADCAITAAAITASGAVAQTLTGLGTTTAAAFIAQNTTAAAAGVQQISSSIDVVGQGWKTNATAASQEVRGRINILPVQGAANPTGTLQFQIGVNGATPTNVLTVSSAGQLSGPAMPVMASLQGISTGALHVQGYNLGIGSASLIYTLIETDGSGLSNCVALNRDQILGWASAASAFASHAFRVLQDTFLGRQAAANIRQGAADAAAPVAQTFSVQNVSTGTSNTAGADRYYDASQGTGTGAGGSHIFRTAPAGGAGSAQNALAAALTITGSGGVVVNTATGFSGYLLNAQVNSATKFRVDGSGNAEIAITGSFIGPGGAYLNVNPYHGLQLARVGYGPSDIGIKWSSGTNPQTPHVFGITPNAQSGATKLEINNGTAGTLRDLALRDLTASGVIVTIPQALSGAGAIDIVTATTAFTSTGAAQALTLADGINGQIKTIVHVAAGGSGVLTPTTKSGYTTITFTNVGDSVTLQFFTGAGWCITGIFGAVAA